MRNVIRNLRRKAVTERRSSVAIKTEKELGEALKRGQNRIEIEGDLTRKVVRIKATGKVAWAIAFGAIAVAVIAALAVAPSGGASAAVSCAMAPVAVGVLGPSVASSAIAVAIAAGGVGALSSLRKYSMEKREDGKVILSKK